MNENVLNKLKLPIILIVILLAISFLSVVPVLNMILLGAMLAYGIRPIASKIQTKTKYQSVSIILAIVIVIIPIILVMVYMIFESIGLMSSFLNAGGFSLGTNSSEVGTIIVQNLPVNVQDMIQPHIGRINAGISQLFSLLLNYIFEFVKSEFLCVCVIHRECGVSSRHLHTTKQHLKRGAVLWWAEVDSNHRSRRRQIYSLIHLAALESAHIFNFVVEPVIGLEPTTC